MIIKVGNSIDVKNILLVKQFKFLVVYGSSDVVNGLSYEENTMRGIEEVEPVEHPMRSVLRIQTYRPEDQRFVELQQKCDQSYGHNEHHSKRW